MRTLSRKEQLRHCAVFLRQHGFPVSEHSAQAHMWPNYDEQSGEPTAGNQTEELRRKSCLIQLRVVYRPKCNNDNTIAARGRNQANRSDWRRPPSPDCIFRYKVTVHTGRIRSMRQRRYQYTATGMYFC